MTVEQGTMKRNSLLGFIKRHSNLVWFLLLGLLGLAVFLPGLGVKYYGDDFGYVLDPAHTSLSAYWTAANLHGWYRPLQMTVMYLVQSQWGLATFPIHALQLILHIGLACLIFQLALDLKLGPLPARIGSLWFLLSQADPIAVQRATTISTGLSVFFGVLMVWLLLRQGFLREDDRRIQLPLYLAALICFILSLLSKESSPIFLILALAAFFLMRLEPLRFGLRVTRTAVLAALPFLIAFLFYYLVHQQVGANPPSFGAGDYQFTISFTVLKNLAMLLLAGVTPVSTVTTYVAATEGAWPLLAACLLFPAIVAGAAIFGIASSRSWKSALVLAAFGVLSLFPMAALNHVSELYVYDALPFLSLLIGLGWAGVLTRAGSPVWISRSVSLGLAGLLLINVVSLETKTRLMVENGDRAEVILRQLAVLSGEVPAGGQFILVNPTEREPSYSVFLVNGFDVFYGARQIVVQAAGRDDFSAKIVPAADFPPGTDFGPDAVAVTLVGDIVTPYPSQ